MSNLAPENDKERLIRVVREALLSRWIHGKLEDQEVADRSGLHPKTVENFKLYRTEPRLATVIAIAQALGLRLAVIDVATLQPNEVRASSQDERKLRKAAK